MGGGALGDRRAWRLRNCCRPLGAGELCVVEGLGGAVRGRLRIGWHGGRSLWGILGLSRERSRDWAVAEAVLAPDRRGRRCHRAPSPLQRLPLYPLQLQLQPCFSLVAQMRPWWSPVSLLPASDTHHPPPPLNLTSVPSCLVLSTPSYQPQ